MAFGAQIK
jgi:hypothetical protein